MRVLQVITSLQTGGAEKLITEIVPMLRKKGHDVDVALFDGRDTQFKKELATCGCKIYSLSAGGSVYNPLLIFKLRKIVKAYDLVHTHNTAAQLFGAIASTGLSRLKKITTEHNTTNRRREWRWYKLMDLWMYKQYDKIICISDQAYINLVAYLGSRYPKTKIDTIYNGIDIKKYHDAKGYDRNTFCPESVGKCVIIMVAAFRPQKNQDTLIKAVSLLPDNQYELWLVGDGERKTELHQLAKSLGIGNRARFWGLRADIPELLHTADIVVMSSHYEGLSLSSIEGMAAGKPFIASDVDGLHEITEGAGLLFEHENEKELAYKIKQLFEDKNYSQQVASHCLDRAADYDIHVTVEKYEQVYVG